jgi:ferritin-like metal-binding protein YciE
VTAGGYGERNAAVPLRIIPRETGIIVMADSKRDILIVGLRNAYAIESQALSTMRNVESRLEHYPELKAAVAQHITETEQQQRLVEECLGRFDTSPSALKDIATKIAGNVQAMFHAVAGDEVLKNTFTLYAFEHFEIASYRSLIVMAEDVGETSVAQTCRQILAQEEAAAEKIGRLIESTTRAYSARESSGAKAAN